MKTPTFVCHIATSSGGSLEATKTSWIDPSSANQFRSARRKLAPSRQSGAKREPPTVFGTVVARRANTGKLALKLILLSLLSLISISSSATLVSSKEAYHDRPGGVQENYSTNHHRYSHHSDFRRATNGQPPVARKLQTENEWQRIKEQLAASLNETYKLDLSGARREDGGGGVSQVSSKSTEQPKDGEPREIENQSSINELKESIERSNSEGMIHELTLSATTTTTTMKPTSLEQQQVSEEARRVRKLLVRHLSSLVMNNEPELIRKTIRSSGGDEHLAGKMRNSAGDRLEFERNYEEDKETEEVEEADAYNYIRSGRHRKMADLDAASTSNLASNSSQFDQMNTNEMDLLQADQAAATLAASDLALASEQEPSELVTCSPDYEDPTILMDPPSNGANLTAEQQAQLLSGSSESLGLTQQQLQQQQLAGNYTPSGLIQQQNLGPPGQCLPAGSRMIEVITKIITPILFGIIIVVGLLGNIIVMLVILEDRKTERELTPTNLLILDLSLADLSFIIFCIPFTGWDYAVGHWVFGQVWCKFNQYLIVVCALSSIYTLVLMSIDRFLAIVYPIECINYRTSRNMLHAIYIKWILILLIAIPTITMHGLIESPLGPEQYNCRFLSDQYNPLHFQIVFFVTSYLSPLVLIFCLYLSLLKKLWYGTKPHGHKESLKMLESKKRVTWLVASIVIVFALCWCPIQIMLILMRLKTHKITATYVAIQVFAHILGYMNSCINPIVYAFASETFNQSFKRSWFGRSFWRCFHNCCCCCCANCCGPQPMPPLVTTATGPGSRSMSLANAHQPMTTYQSNSHHYINNGNRTMTSGNNSNQLTLVQMSQSRNKSLNHIFSPSTNTVDDSDGDGNMDKNENDNSLNIAVAVCPS